MKKLISLLLVFAMLTGVFAMCGVTAFAEENDIMDYITYEIYDGEVTITDCDESISGDVVIPDTIEGYPVTYIEVNAFSNCNNVVSYYFPASITSLDLWNDFGNSVEKYIVDEQNLNYSSDDYGVIYNKEKTAIIKYPCAKESSEYIISDSIIGIENQAFFHCTNLVDIYFPDSIEYIGFQAFMDCTSLKSVVIPDGVILDYSVFYGCASLTDAVIGRSEGISNSLFYECTNLENVKINTKVISGSAFSACCNLKNIELGDNVESIEMSAFEYCKALEEIYIPANVTVIDTFAFHAATALKNIIIDENNPVYASENGMMLSKDKTRLITVPHGIDSVHDIPESVTTIGEAAYYVFLDAEIDLKNVEVIETAAYVHCLAEEELVIPESVTHIKPFAFLTCYYVKDVYIYNPDVQLDELCIGYSELGVFVEKDEFIELAKKAYFTPNSAERDAYYAEFEQAIVYYDDLEPIEGLTIHGYEGSTAQTYAEENGFRFVPICKHNYVDTVITPATYTQTGEGGMVCEHCGDVQSTYEIPMLKIEDSEEKVDKDTGVSVVFPEGTFDGDVEVEVTPVEEGKAYKLISHKEGNFKVTMFDINITADGQKVQPNGTVLVKIPLPKGYNQNKCVVYYVAEDGTMEELKTYHYKDGYVYFETDHFSYYAILENTEEDNNQTSVSFIDKIVIFLKRIVEFFKKLFFEATGRA